MNALEWLSPTAVCVDFDPRTVRVAHGGKTRQWALERDAEGRLTETCRERLKNELPAWLERKHWQPRTPAWCALAGHGVSLRRWKLPRTALEELPRVLRLQIESEFPLAPEDLAWGWVRLGEAGAFQDVLVAAVKRETVDEYAELLRACGLSPTFTLSALARQALAPATAADHSLLEVGSTESEWLGADAAGATRLRLVPWGEENLLQTIAAQTGVPRDTAADLLRQWCSQPGDLSPEAARALTSAVDGLAGLLPAAGLGRTLRLSGRLAGHPPFVRALGERLGSGTACESIERNGSVDVASALRGLRRLAEVGNPNVVLRLQTHAAEPTAVLARPAPRKWAIVGAVLLLALLALPSLEALLLQPRLARQVAAIKANQGRMELIDRQTDFLRYLKQNQSAYLDTLFVLAKTAPPGAKVDSLSLNRKGELALRISMRQPPEVTDFRTKLVDSGFFSSVVVEEQAPSPDRQKIMVRISAQLKAPPTREGLPILSTNAPAGGAPGGPGAGFPGMPPGMPMGMPMGLPGQMPAGPPPGITVDMPPGGPPTSPSPGGPASPRVRRGPPGSPAGAPVVVPGPTP